MGVSTKEVVAFLSEELEKLHKQEQELHALQESLKATMLHIADNPRGNGAGPLTSKNLTEVAYHRLREVGEPVHRKALYDYLITQGLTIGGQNPVGNMTAHMSQDARFESVGDGHWGLVEWKSVVRLPNRSTSIDILRLAESVSGRRQGEEGQVDPFEVDPEDLP